MFTSFSEIQSCLATRNLRVFARGIQNSTSIESYGQFHRELG